MNHHEMTQAAIVAERRLIRNAKLTAAVTAIAAVLWWWPWWITPATPTPPTPTPGVWIEDPDH